MAGKRQASNQLTHDNWEDEDDVEEAGVFQQADATELKTRVIKRAKRRGVTNTSDDPAEKPALFTGFQGFGIPTPENPTFVFNKAKESTALENIKPFGLSSFAGSNGDSKSTQAPVPTAGPASPRKSPKTEAKQPEAHGDTQPAHTQKDINKSKFFGSLKALNKSMMNWLQLHMDKNPMCYFTPVFNDYSKHLAGLKKKYNIDDASMKFISSSQTTTTSESTAPTQTVVTSSPQASKPNETINVTPLNKPFPVSANTNTAGPLLGFSFGSTQKVQPESESISSSANTISFGAKASTTEVSKETSTAITTTSPIFSFGTNPSEAPPPAASESGETKAAETTEKPAPMSLFSFGTKPPSDASSTANLSGSIFGPSSATSGFSFATRPTVTASSTFTFGKTAETVSAGFGAKGTDTSGFSFKAAVASAASADSAAGASSSAAADNEEEYVPPKPEVENKITEDDALYTKRVKLFYEKEGKYVDKGVGNLFVKPLDNGKNSLLVRADTNLGNILLNISLAESIPIKRMGKNNVTLVCVANPPMEPKAKDSTIPTMLLVRVKTEEDADELFQKLEEYKKA